MTIKYKYKGIENSIDKDSITLTTSGKYLEDNITIETDAGLYKSTYIPREVSSNGVYGFPANNFSFSLPDATSIGDNSLQYAFHGCTSLTDVSFPELVNIDDYSLYKTFASCTSLNSINFPKLTNISDYALSGTFNNCTSLTSVSFPSLISMNGNNPIGTCFSGCTSLTNVNLPVLTEIISGDNMFSNCTSLETIEFPELTILDSYFMFNGCKKLNTVLFPKLEHIKSWGRSKFANCSSLNYISFPSLNKIDTNGLEEAFKNCTSLTDVLFPALDSSSFGDYKDQFSSMLEGVNGCTVHFPSILSDVIGEWSSITSGFGGTNTTVLFDLPTDIYKYEVNFSNIPSDINIFRGYSNITDIGTKVYAIGSNSKDINLLIKRDGYIPVNYTFTITENTIIDISTLTINWIEMPQSLDLHYNYSGYENILGTLVDGNNFIINSDLQAITSGPSSYNINYGSSYGYILIQPSVDTVLSITGYVSSDSWDYGGIYIGTQEYRPIRNDIRIGATDGTGSWLFNTRGKNTSSTYTIDLTGGIVYYINFCYAKDDSGNSYEDRLIITDIVTTPKS